ncbi:MAG: DNA replication/repair protein RecF [Lentisphaeria bacterium]|nr:DNA replication/repair protein RecF [Lentisphaeria bacterium]
MSLVVEKLELVNFRNYERARLDFTEPVTVFAGNNGAGKSNLLEAVHFLSILRSFRGSAVRDMIRIGERSFRLRARVRHGKFASVLTAEQEISGRRRLLIDDVPVARSSEFIREFRAVVFAPEDKYLTAGSSACRRRFFDMLISVMEPAYLTALQRYGAALMRRNAALRMPGAAGTAAAAAFEPELAAAAAVIVPARRRWSMAVCERANALLGEERLALTYEPGYPDTETEYAAKLAATRERDRKRTFTSFGPQTDDFLLTLDGKNLRSFGSNGQLRLVSLYLKMAEFALIRAESSAGVVALVDDVTGELDERNRRAFYRLLSGADQCFFTFAAHPEDEFFRHAGVIDLPIAGPGTAVLR